MTASHQRKNIHFLIQDRSYGGRIPDSESGTWRVTDTKTVKIHSLVLTM